MSILLGPRLHNYQQHALCIDTLNIDLRPPTWLALDVGVQALLVQLHDNAEVAVLFCDAQVPADMGTGCHTFPDDQQLPIERLHDRVFRII